MRYRLDQNESASPSFKNEEGINGITSIYFQDDVMYLNTQRNSLVNLNIASKSNCLIS